MDVLAFAVFAVASAALAAVDARTHRLPDALVLPAAAIALVLLLLTAVRHDDPARITGALVGAGLLLALPLVVHAVRPAVWGGGDVKLAALVGLHLGWRGMDAIALGAAAGALLSGAAGAGALSVRRGGEVPLGPPLLAGCWWGLAATLCPRLLCRRLLCRRRAPRRRAVQSPLRCRRCTPRRPPGVHLRPARARRAGEGSAAVGRGGVASTCRHGARVKPPTGAGPRR